VRELTGDSLLTSKYASHQRQRRLMQPAFNRNRIKGYASVMNEMIDSGSLGVAGRRGDLDIAAAMYDITSRTAARNLFAADVRRPAAARWLARSRYLNGLFIPDDGTDEPLGPAAYPRQCRYDKAVKLLHESVDEIIASRDLRRRPNDLLIHAAGRRREDGGKLTRGVPTGRSRVQVIDTTREFTAYWMFS